MPHVVVRSSHLFPPCICSSILPLQFSIITNQLINSLIDSMVQLSCHHFSYHIHIFLLPPLCPLLSHIHIYTYIHTEMTKKVSNFTHLIQRVTTSCLIQPPLPETNEQEEENCHSDDSDSQGNNKYDDEEVQEEDDDDYGHLKVKKEMEEEVLMDEVFESVSRMKRAYVGLQDAHCPWDKEKMRVADVAVVAELKKLAVLRERWFRRKRGGGGGGVHELRVREVVAPYEAVMEDLKKQVKDKDLQIQGLEDKLESVVALSCKCKCNGGENKSGTGRHHPNTKLAFTQVQAIPAAPSPQLFEAEMVHVREATKYFTSLLLSLMHKANWDITAAVCSIEAAIATTTEIKCNNASSATTMVSPHHAKYALESYISQKIFQGFDHETFYIDGSLSTLLNPHQFRRDCFVQYQDMKSMDPTELLGILPTCHFGKFCSKKYLDIVHPKMEESLFGNLEQQSQVSAGNHPRTRFYNEFLGVAKAVWLLHLVAFSLDPAPCHFEASRGAEFHPQYMQSVAKFSGGRVTPGQVVGFPVSPGFKLGGGFIIKARVYLMSRT